jgi:hypothetical protein
MIFLEQNPTISSFDIYRPSWTFLNDSSKFTSITRALTSAAAMDDKKKRVSSPDESNADSPVIQTLVTRTTRPIGNKKSKRAAEEKKIIESVCLTLQKELSQGHNAGSSAVVLAAALSQFTNVISTSLQQWHYQQAYNNTDPELKK